MSNEIQVGATFHKKRVGKHIAMVEGPSPTAPASPKGRLPRIMRYMAIAIYYEDLIRQGHVHDYAEIALLGHVNRARVTQIMNLRLLSPCIQEQLLNAPRISNGRDNISLRKLQALCLTTSWETQQNRWVSILKSSSDLDRENELS